MKTRTPFTTLSTLFTFFTLLTFFILMNSGCLKKVISKTENAFDAVKVKAIYPTVDCPVDEARPIFAWTEYRTIRKDLKYRFVLVKMEDKQDAKSAIEKNEKLADEKDIETTEIKLPTIASDLRPNTVYAFQISAYEGTTKKIVSKSDVNLFYTLDAKLPDFFQSLLCCEQNLIEKAINKWKTAYGTPEINEKEKGCFTSKGTIQIRGNRIGGDAVYQKLNNSNKIKKGNYYQISFCAKPYPKEMDYVRFRILAYNGTLPPTGTHPETSENIAVIGESGDIESKDWNRYFLSSWKAPKDFENIAVLVVTNETTLAGAQAIGSISNICLQVTDGCGLNANDLGFTEDGGIPDEAKNYIDPKTKPEFLDIDFSQGSLEDMFGQPFNDDGKSNWYGLGDECISIGGDIPAEAEELVNKYLEFKLPGGISLETFNEGMKTFYEKFGHKMELPKWDPIPEEKENDCRPQLDKSKPFKGRDIIYVHGLVLDHILKRTVANDQTGYLKGVALATNFATNTILDSVSKSWPNDQQEFYPGGFYHNMALSYFDHHIEHFLGDIENPSNRYMLVAYNSSQRLIDNVHAALTQISAAMNEGKGVYYDKKDPRGSDCFGKEVVIISHSTGALLMDVSMAIAEMSADDEAIQKSFGNAKYIADRSKVHISLHGAIAGSELAALGVIGANIAAVAAVGADVAVDVKITVSDAFMTGKQMIYDAMTGLNTTGTTNNTSAIEAFLDVATDSIVIIARNFANTFNNSVLVDLSPHVAKRLWGSYINQNKVPVLTVAGGHPIAADQSIVTKWILPGFDDGVVSANSQSGSPSMSLPELYLYIPPESRIFQMGIDLKRSVPYFAEQSKGVFGAAYGSIPWLSPAGMVQPVAIVAAPSPRYANHFPFLQSASEHMHSIEEPMNYTSTFGASNFEECLVVENNFVFNEELVNPEIISLVSRRIRGLDLILTFKIYYPIFDFWPPPPTVTWGNYTFPVTIPLWRRTYDTLSGSNFETDLVYNFVLR
jgi:hypothetical protein